jgi:beta-glucosidase
VNPKVVRPVKELKNFAKVALAPGETKTVELELGPRDFAYWDVVSHSWRVDAGEYEIIVGNLVARILVKNSVYIR